jgi:hypothetical protein
MKPSKLLTDFVKDLDKPRWNEAASRKFLARMADPAFGRKPIYAWLVTNHDEVARLRHRLDRPGWDSIAQVMAADGVLGARGAAPNGNAVRRVWKRVCCRATINMRTRVNLDENPVWGEAGRA